MELQASGQRGTHCTIGEVDEGVGADYNAAKPVRVEAAAEDGIKVDVKHR